MRKNSFISNADRKKIIDAYLDGKTLSDIASMLQFKKPAISAILKKYKSGESVERKPVLGGSRRKSLSNDDVAHLKSWIDQDCSISLKSIRQRLADEHGVQACQTTISRYINAFEYTFKRISNIPEKRNDELTIQKRKTYVDEFMNLVSTTDESKIYFLDEVGFNVSMRSKGGRSQIGTRAIKIVPSIRSRNISICCTINKNGIYKYKAETRAFNGELFSSFLNSLMEKLRSDGIQGAVLIMDNVPFHKSTLIKQIVEENGHKLLFLPPYSPFLNPIENMFSKWKQIVRRGNVQNEEELINAIETSSSLITEDDCNGYYRHMFGIIPRIIRGEPIFDE